MRIRRDSEGMASLDDPVLLLGDLVALGEGQARLRAPDGRCFDLDDLSDPTLVALGMLDGNLSWASLLGTGDASAALFSRLDALGLLRSPVPVATLRRVRLYGAGSLGWRVASDLVRAPATLLTLVDATPAPPPDHGLSSAESLADRLRSVRGARVVVDRHWPVDGARVDLAIVASRTIEPDRAVVADLARNGVPTLLLQAHETSATVGPLLHPSASACLHCHDLSRSDADAAWPVVVAELSARPARPSPVVVGWAAGVAVALAEALRTGIGVALDATVWRLDQASGAQRTSTWAAHPSCGCRFGQAA